MLIRAFLLALAVLPAVARGQGIPPDSLLPGAGFEWERLGDRGVNTKGFAFSPDGTIWSAGNGIYRLDPATGVWTPLSNRIQDALIVFPAATAGADTVVVNGGGSIYRSTSGGQTWVEVSEEGGLALRADGPPGLLLAGTGHNFGVWRSADRGATWVAAAYPDANANAQADAVLPLSPTPERPSWRMLAGGPHGVTASADSARTFRTTPLWRVLDYYVDELAAIEGPAGARRVLAGGYRSGQPLARVWASDDDGATWAEAARLRDVADGGVSGGYIKVVLPLGGRSAFVLMGRGTLHRTDDGGQTWSIAGRAPEIDTVGVYATGGVIGPDGRLYVGLLRTGCCVREFAYRTAQPVVVASEPAPPPVGSGPSLVAVPNPSAGAVALLLTLPTAEVRVRVAVYDGLGREVAVAQEGPLGAGEHRLLLNTSALAPGVYVARVTAGGGAATVRLALTR